MEECTHERFGAVLARRASRSRHPHFNCLPCSCYRTGSCCAGGRTPDESVRAPQCTAACQTEGAPRSAMRFGNELPRTPKAPRRLGVSSANRCSALLFSGRLGDGESSSAKATATPPRNEEDGEATAAVSDARRRSGVAAGRARTAGARTVGIGRRALIRRAAAVRTLLGLCRCIADPVDATTTGQGHWVSGTRRPVPSIGAPSPRTLCQHLRRGRRGALDPLLALFLRGTGCGGAPPQLHSNRRREQRRAIGQSARSPRAGRTKNELLVRDLDDAERVLVQAQVHVRRRVCTTDH